MKEALSEALQTIHDYRGIRSRLQLFLSNVSHASSTQPLEHVFSQIELLVLPYESASSSAAASPDDFRSSSSTSELRTLLETIRKQIGQPKQTAVHNPPTAVSGDGGDTSSLHVARSRSSSIVSSGSFVGQEGVQRIGDLPNPLVVSLLATLFQRARVAESFLDQKIAEKMRDVQRICQEAAGGGGGGKGSLRELSSVLQSELQFANSSEPTDCNFLILPFQSFQSVGARNLLLHVLAAKTYLRVVDLSECLLGDHLALEVLRHTSEQQHLVSLNLVNNCLTNQSANALLSYLAPKSPSPETDADTVAGTTHHNVFSRGQGAPLPTLTSKPNIAVPSTLVVRFPQLLSLNLQRNDDISVDVLEQLGDVLARRAVPLRSSSLRSSTREKNKVTRILHAEGGPAMQAVILARSLMQFPNDDAYEAFRSSFHGFSASSFSSIIAVAMALGLPRQRIAAFFDELVRDVFVPYKMVGYYAVASTRWVRQWWTGGNYYNATLFSQKIVDLFGEATCQKTLPTIEQETNKKILLFVASHDGGTHTSSATAVTDKFPPLHHRRVGCFRSSSPAPTHSNGTLFDVPNSSKTTLLDALLACCATPTLFSARSIGDRMWSDALVSPLVPMMVEWASMCLLHHDNSVTASENGVRNGAPLEMTLLAGDAAESFQATATAASRVDPLVFLSVAHASCTTNPSGPHATSVSELTSEAHNAFLSFSLRAMQQMSLSDESNVHRTRGPPEAALELGRRRSPSPFAVPPPSLWSAVVLNVLPTLTGAPSAWRTSRTAIRYDESEPEMISSLDRAAIAPGDEVL